MSTVVIKGTEGLGNRLLSLEFALRFAHSRQYAVEIDWSDPVYMVDKDCFVKHFELIGIELISVDRKNPGLCYPPALAEHLDDDINSWSYRAPFLPIIPSSIALWRKIRSWSESRIVKGSGMRRFFSGEHLHLLQPKYDTYLYACDLPYKEPERFRHVRLRHTPIVEHLSALGLQHEVDIAVHIRSTDKSGKNLGGLFAALHSKRQEFLQAPLLHLATDNQDVFELFRREFDELYSIQSIPLDRANDPIHLRQLNRQQKREDFLNALADIFVLSRSNHFFFQENSSFSRVAIAISHPQCIATNWLDAG